MSGLFRSRENAYLHPLSVLLGTRRARWQLQSARLSGGSDAQLNIILIPAVPIPSSLQLRAQLTAARPAAAGGRRSHRLECRGRHLL